MVWGLKKMNNEFSFALWSLKICRWSNFK